MLDLMSETCQCIHQGDLDRDFEVSALAYKHLVRELHEDEVQIPRITVRVWLTLLAESDHLTMLHAGLYVHLKCHGFLL
jgi:hypothetical protein